MTDVLAAEWLKLRSIRPTYYALVAVAGVVVFGAFVTWFGVVNWDRTPGGRGSYWSTPVEQGMLPVLQLCLAVLGALAMTTEYATRMIRTTLAVVPRRRVVLAGKAVTVGGLALCAGLVATFVLFFASRLIVGDRPWRGYTSPVAHEIPRLVVCALSVSVAAVVGLGLATVFRSTAGAVVPVCVLLLAGPVLSGLLPAPWGARVDAAMLPNLPGQFAGAGDVLSPAGALAILTAYVIVALVAAALAFTRRDA